MDGLPQLQRAFKSKIAAAEEAMRTKVIVGYKSPYALYVHENIEMVLRGQRRKSGIGVYWGTPGGSRGQAKFLEAPQRRLSKNGTLTRLIAREVRAGKTYWQALNTAGKRILAESLPLVPVEYGDLAKSGFVSVRKN